MRQRVRLFPPLLIVLLIAGAVFGETPDDFVDLPAEFFFGRWAGGHEIASFAVLNPHSSVQGYTG